MHIETLRIQGFKSFCDRTEMDFKPGITAIIGPNGCGKSNISDAIRWVMGEQNVRNLRGYRMEDLIFNGAGKRKPLGFAEVSMTIQTSSDAPNAMNGHFEVTRRLFRSGDSEFYINKVPCRLRDIVDLFLDSGLGKGSYAMIEQGKVDLVLSSRPKERRMLIEEAAGIVRYKVKKEEALRKITDTRSNLVRIDDRLYELDNQSEILKKQAAKARRFLREKEAITTLELQLASYRYFYFNSRLKISRERIGVLSNDIGLQEAAIARLITKKITVEQELEELRTSIRQIEKERVNLERDIDVAIHTRETAAKRIEELSVEIEGISRERLELQKKITTAQSSISEQEIEHETMCIHLDEAEETLTRLNSRHADLMEAIAEKKREHERAKRDLIKTLALETQLNQQKMKLISLKEIFEKEQARLERERERMELKESQLVPQYENFSTDIDEKENQRNELKDILEAINSDIAEENSRLSYIADEISSIQEKIHRSEARLSSLQELETSMEGYSSGLKSLLEANRSGHFTDFSFELFVNHIRVAQEHRHLLALALHDYQDLVVIKTQAEMSSFVQALDKKVKGRLPIISHEFCHTANNAAAKGYSPSNEKQSLLSLIECDREMEEVTRYLLGQTFLVDSLDIGFRLWKESGRQCRFICQDGTIIRQDGSIVAGQDAEGTVEIFSRKQEIHSLQQDLREMQLIEESLAGQRQEILDSVIALERDLEENRETFHQIDIDMKSLERDRAAIQRALDECHDGLKINRIECEQLELDKKSQGHELLTIEDRITLCEAEKEEKESHIAGIEEESESLDRDKESMQEELTRCQVECSTLKERTESLAQALLTKEQLIEEFESQITRLDKREKDAKSQRRENEQLIQSSEGTLGHSNENLISVRTELENLTILYNDKREEVDNIESEENKLRTQVIPLHEELGEKKLEAKELETTLTHLVADIVDRLKTPLDHIESIEGMPPNHEEAEKLHRKIELMKQRLEDFEDVNLAAPKEHEQILEKIEDIRLQKNDIMEAIDALQETVDKIDNESQQRFNACFTQVNENFKHLFKRLFGGGYAELQLEDESDLLETGITIIAQPPGKKLQALTLLSGGEKALTAVALLVAIFQYRPSPFCFMDEVDAPLDEINTERFCRLLQELSERAQIIMITHSRKSLEAAEIFYGVTMPEPGISRLISFELPRKEEEAKLTA